MTDNASVNTNTGATGATNIIVATDNIGGVDYQRFKATFGVDGVATDVSATDPLPVVQTGTPALPTGASTAAKQPALGVAGTASADVITVQGVSGMTAVKVDGSGVTQPISAAALPLPSGAATAAKQAALGTAGTASTDVLTVQGIASMTALKVDGSAVTQPVSGNLTNISGTISLPTGASTAANQASVIGTKAAGTAATNSMLAGGLYNTTLPTLTNGQQAALQVDASGRMLTSVAAIAAGTNIVGKVGIDQTTDGTTNKVVARIVDSGGTALDYTVPALIEGGIAHDSPVSTGKPLVIAGRGANAQPTAVSADGDVTRIMTDLKGRQVILPQQIRELVFDTFATCSNTTTAQDLISAAGAGIFTDLISITLANSGSAGTVVQVLNADGTTVRWTGYAPPTDMRGITLPVILKGAAANAKWMIKTVTATTALVATVQYVQNT